MEDQQAQALIMDYTRQQNVAAATIQGPILPPLVFNSIARAGARNAGGYSYPFLPPIHPGIRVGDAVQLPIPRPPPPSVPPKFSFVAFQPIHMAILHLLLIVMCLCLFANNLYL